jgi:hypothetical protein
LKEGRERVLKRAERDNWQRTRLLAYITGKPYFAKQHQNMTVYEFMPLPDDPTEEQLKEIKEQKQNQEVEEAMRILSNYEARGLIGKNAIKN